MKTKTFFLLVIFILLGINSYSQEIKTKQNTKNSKKAIKTEKIEKQESTVKTSDLQYQTTQKDNNNITKDTSKESLQSQTIKPIEIVNGDQLSKNASPVITQQANGSINWTEQYIEAKGTSVIDYERFPNKAQAKAMATRGAIVEAQRNLLEITQGVKVVSETTVKDMMTQSDYIYSRVEGIVKGAQQVGEPIEKDGVIEVKLRVPLYETNGLAPAVYDAIPGIINTKSQSDENLMLGDNKALDVNDTTQNIIPDGLVFNFNGKKFDPSLFPLIVDQNGNILLDLSMLYNPKEGKFPKILSSTKDIFQELNFKEGTDVIDVIQSYDGKIVVDGDSVKKRPWWSNFTNIVKKGLNVGAQILKFILLI
ncbi:MAG: hypothetical protein PWQ43_558 [Rikenellaceae bacterium]|nr:hypothetical protein [Rikenellaceae bacterium]